MTSASSRFRQLHTQSQDRNNFNNCPMHFIYSIKCNAKNKNSSEFLFIDVFNENALKKFYSKVF